MGKNYEWHIASTAVPRLDAFEVDKASEQALGVPLQSAAKVTAAGAAAVTAALSRPDATDVAASLLAGVQRVPLQFLEENTPWAPVPAHNGLWNLLLQPQRQWSCEGSPIQDPICLQRFIQSQAEQLQSMLLRATGQWRVAALLRSREALSGGAVVVWGENAGGGAFGWHHSCSACLQRGVRDGVFLMSRPPWLLRAPWVTLAGQQPRAGGMQRPTGLLSHHACSVQAPEVTPLRLQCGLPTWDPPVEAEGEGGDRLHCMSDGMGCAQLMNRTAFVSHPLWASHYSHYLFQYVLPMWAVTRDLGGDPARDVLADLRSFDAPEDVSMLVDAPLVRVPGTLPPHVPAGVTNGIIHTCFRQTVTGAAGLSPGIDGAHVFNSDATDAAVAEMRRRLGLPQPPPPRRRPRVYFVQRKTNTRSILNAEQLGDVLRAFSGLTLLEPELEHGTLKQQASLFGQADMLIAMHGNALGNAVWMPRTSVTVEYLPPRFPTWYFSAPSSERGQPWLQRRCKPGMLGVPLSEEAVEQQLARLQAHPLLAPLVGPDTRAALRAVQRTIDADGYSVPPSIRMLPCEQPVVNVRPDNAALAKCEVLAQFTKDGDMDAKNAHSFIPPAQFLGDFVDAAVLWAEAFPR